jgi:NADP-dependent 3-hydroxy acid dehydrogenase YdfG
MTDGIEGKVVLIMGGAGGIGSETAKTLAAAGARIAVADIDRERLDKVTEALSAISDVPKGYHVDVTDKEQTKLVVDQVVRDFGALDVLINSAGVMLIRPMAEVNVVEWETTIDLNIKGTLWAIAAALPIFLRQQRGHIINLGSVHGLKVSPGGAVHSGSKFAIRAISEGLRSEMVGEPIRVTTITPRSTPAYRTRRRAPTARGFWRFTGMRSHRVQWQARSPSRSRNPARSM